MELSVGSIREGELLQPIVVRPLNGSFEIVAGERRYRAFQILKEPKIAAIVRDIKDDIDALEKSLIENLQRDDLTDIEEENAVHELWESKRHKTQIDLARKLGVHPAYINEKLQGYNYRKKQNFHENVPTRTIAHTSILKDDNVRKKVIEKIPASRIDETVKKLKEFPEPEQQLEILEEYEKQEEWSKDAFDTIVEEKKQIVEKKRPPEWQPPQEEHRWFLDDMERHFEKIYTYGIGNLGELPKKQRDESVEILSKLQK